MSGKQYMLECEARERNATHWQVFIRFSAANRSKNNHKALALCCLYANIHITTTKKQEKKK